MYCPNCGWKNDENAVRCINCSADLRGNPDELPTMPQPQQPSVPNYVGLAAAVTVLSVFCTLFALPFGIVAIVKAVQANKLSMLGHYSEAAASARAARIWIYVTIGIWIALIIATIILILIKGPGTIPRGNKWL